MLNVTQILAEIEQGDASASEKLLPLVYDELRKMAALKMAQEKPGQTLQATALVHEAFLRLVDVDQPRKWSGRGHFFAVAAEAMRRILVEQARHKQSQKAGGEFRRLDVDVAAFAAAEKHDADLLILDDALRQLEAKDARKAAVVKLRFFAGLTVEQAAEALGVSTSTVEKDWTYARGWLRVAIDRASGNRP